MPRRAREASSPVSTDIHRPVNLYFEVDNLILESIKTIEELYGERKPTPFPMLEAFVDCRNHLVKALAIVREKLVQLPLSESTNPDQPELPLEEGGSNDQG